MNLIAIAKASFPDSNGGLPIFMFHRVSFRPPTANWPQLYIAPPVFAGALAVLKDSGGCSLELDDAFSPSPGDDGFVLTFDDGFVSALKNAGPLLSAFGFRAINFLVADRLGMRNEWDEGVDRTMEPLMDASQVQDWLSLG